MNLTSKEVITFGSYISKSKPPLEHTRFPKEEDSSCKYIEGVYYLVFLEKPTADAIHEFIYNTSS